MRTTHLSPYVGVSVWGGRPDRDPPRQKSPEQIPLDREPPEGAWDQVARQEVTSYRDPPVNRQTPVKTLPCSKLRLWGVTIMSKGLKEKDFTPNLLLFQFVGSSWAHEMDWLDTWINTQTTLSTAVLCVKRASTDRTNWNDTWIRNTELAKTKKRRKKKKRTVNKQTKFLSRMCCGVIYRQSLNRWCHFIPLSCNDDYII